MSKIARPAGSHQQDQKKIYLDWANHYLRKVGQTHTALSDLKDISDGFYLPKVIQAVVAGDIPGVHQDLSTDDQRHENIEACIKYLQEVGVSCNSFKAKDITDGNMRAILSLFYNLSQFKKSTKSEVSNKTSTPLLATQKSIPAVSNGASVSTSLPNKTLTPAIATTSTPSLAITRRTAGSSIMTTTTYDKPYSQRRKMFKPMEAGDKSVLSADSDKDSACEEEVPEETVAVVNDVLTDSQPTGIHSVVQNGVPDSAPAPDSTTTRSLTGSKLSKLSKGSYLSARPSEESPLHHSYSSINNQSAATPKGSPDPEEEGKERELKTPVRSKSIPRSGANKLQSPAQFRKSSTTKAVTKGEVPTESDTKEVKPEDISRPQSRLKFPGPNGRSTPSDSGRSTPSSLSRTSIQRPSSRLSKPGFTSDKPGHTEEDTHVNKASPESRLRLQRKGSDGAVKRYKVSNTGTSIPGVGMIESGTSSLPHSLPKGIINGGSPGGTPEAMRKSLSKNTASSGRESSTGSSQSIDSEVGTEKNSPNQLKVSTSVGCLRKPGGGGFGFTVRTPSHTPQTTPTTDRPQLSQSLDAPSDNQSAGTKAPEPTNHVGVERKSTFSGATGSKLSRFVGHSKLNSPHTTHTSQPPVTANNSQPPVTANNSQPPVTPHTAQPSVTPHITQPTSTETLQLSDSLSSLESSDIKILESAEVGSQGSEVILDNEPIKPDSLELPNSQSVSSGIISPPAGFKSLVKEDSGDGEHAARYGPRISPEGMSHEEATSPRDVSRDVTKEPSELVEDLNRKNQEMTEVSEAVVSDEPGVEPRATITYSDAKKKALASKLGFNQPETGQSETLESLQLLQKQGQGSSTSDVTTTPIHVRKPSEEDVTVFPPTEASDDTTRVSRLDESAFSSSPSKQRARSVSPKASRRIRLVPGHTFVPVNFGGAPFDIGRSGSSDDMINNVSSRTPLKSSLRTGGRKSSSSSVESNSSSPARIKVTISPRSSQLVYDPATTGLQPPKHDNHHMPKMSDRPVSYAEVSNSTSMAPHGGKVYHSQVMSANLARQTSVRGTLSERLDYQEDMEFLERRLVPNGKGSNPEFELIETFETQLSTMKKDLASKDLMLSMYETSMADLSSKVHYLKKTLDEKDREIRQLTDEKTLSPWGDLDGRSLASRATSDAGILSDGCLSDSEMDPGSKAGKKKKKSWKRFSFRKSKKDSLKDHLSPNILDNESVISGRSGRSLRRTLSAKRKTPDLMSISEYMSIDPRFRDADTKSTYTLDARSEFAAALPMIWADEAIEVYDDGNQGSKVKVYLKAELIDGVTSVNNSGSYSNNVRRHSSSSTNSVNQDSFGSHNDDSSHHGDNQNRIVLGNLSVTPEASWVTMDTKIGNIFMHHLNAIDQEGYLGLSEDSIFCYFIGYQRRAIGNALLPPLTPYQAISESSTIEIQIRGAAQESCDALAYKTLMSAETLKSYMNMLQDTHWLVVMGTKGTCKSSLASGLSRHLSLLVSNEESDEVEDVVGGVGGEIVPFSLDKDGLEAPLKYINNDLVKRTQLNLQPPILLLEDIYECKDLEQVLVAATVLQKRPYIIATLCSGTMKGIPLHQLMFHHEVRVVTCNPSTEPVVGILARSLRKQIYQLKTALSDVNQVSERMVNWLPYLLDHLNQFINKFHSNVVNLGPSVFMGCSLQQTSSELEAWFLNLWNYFIIPYLMGTIMAGIETYTADPQLEWTDVREWVVETYPWQPPVGVNKLRTLNPEDVGWNHAVRPQQNRLMMLKDDDTRSMIHA